MKNLLSLVLGACLLFTLPAGAASTDPTEPTIEAVNGKMVKIRVPAGFDRVTLQHYVVPRRPGRATSGERWRTLSTKYPRGTATVLKVKMPTLIAKRFLRVYGSKVETLPGSLLTGIVSFLPDPVDADTVVNSDGLTPGALNRDSATVNGMAGNVGASDSTPRAVTESDIWKTNGDRLYFFNELRGLQVFDLSRPNAPTLLGTLRLPGSGDDLYLIGNTHAVLLKQSANWFGGPVFFDGGGLSPASTGRGTLTVNGTLNLGMSNATGSVLTLGAGATVSLNAASSSPTRARVAVRPQPAGSGSGEIIVADVRAGAPTLVARVPYDGTLAESRMVGSVLYLASNVYHAATDKEAAEYGLQLTSFDLADPANPMQRDTLFLGGWANAVTATDRFFLVAKYEDYDGSWSHNSIELIDISAPDGTMKRTGKAKVQGNVSSKFNMNIDGDVLTVVAQNSGEIGVGNPDDLVFRATSFTKLQTFSIADPAAPVALGSVVLAPGETVRATRFDSARAYVVTFRQVDPLFVVDLKNPAQPSVSGEVEAPGFSTYIEPLGDRLVTIGLVDWQPAVSLFDVSDPAAPKLLTQLKLGAKNGWAHSEAVWNEKAFKVLPDENLIMVPVSASGEDGGWFSRVQLIDLLPGKLVKRGAIVHDFSPRRATLIGKCVVAISSTRLVTVNAADRDNPVVKADLEIAWSVSRVFSVGKYLVQIGGSADYSDRRAPLLSVSRGDDTDDTLTSIDLVNLPVLGATVKDDILYLAQGETGYYSGDGLTKSALTVSAYDLARLPALPLLGSVTTRTKLDSGDLSALWPSPGILVWSGSSGGSSWVGKIWYDPAPYRPIFGILDEASVAKNDGTGIIDPPGNWMTHFYYANCTRLVAFDFTRPQAPKFLSDIKVGADQPWDLSDPFESDGLVYLSYKFFGNVVPAANGDTAGADAPGEPESPRAHRHFLVRVDYADPAVPVIDDTQINLPGRLTGLARSGKLLFTIGRNYDIAAGTPTVTGSALQVSAFDGTAAHLLDTLPLASVWQPMSIQRETVFTLDGQPSRVWHRPPLWISGDIASPAANIPIERFWGGGTWEENPKTSLLAAWQLDDAGKFTKLGQIEAAHDTSLFVFGGLVITQGESRTLHLFDGSNTAKFESIGEYKFDGWVWPDLTHADGGLNTGFWVPLGNYGVETVAAPPSPK